MAKANSNLTQEEIVAKEAEEKAKADALVKDLASKENDDKSPEDTSDKTQEEIAAKEAEEKAKADALVKDLASKENDDKSPEDTSDKTQEEIAAKEAEDESAQDVPDDEKRTFEVYDHMVKYKGVFYNAGAKVPLE